MFGTNTSGFTSEMMSWPRSAVGSQGPTSDLRSRQHSKCRTVFTHNIYQCMRHTQSTHRAHTEHTQSTHRAHAEHPQSTHRAPTEHPHRAQTASRAQNPISCQQHHTLQLTKRHIHAASKRRIQSTHATHPSQPGPSPQVRLPRPSPSHTDERCYSHAAAQTPPDAPVKHADRAGLYGAGQ
jgi:hypothetical protein